MCQAQALNQDSQSLLFYLQLYKKATSVIVIICNWKSKVLIYLIFSLWIGMACGIPMSGELLVLISNHHSQTSLIYFALQNPLWLLTWCDCLSKCALPKQEPGGEQSTPLFCPSPADQDCKKAEKKGRLLCRNISIWDYQQYCGGCLKRKKKIKYRSTEPIVYMGQRKWYWAYWNLPTQGQSSGTHSNIRGVCWKKNTRRERCGNEENLNSTGNWEGEWKRKTKSWAVAHCWEIRDKVKKWGSEGSVGCGKREWRKWRNTSVKEVP